MAEPLIIKLSSAYRIDRRFDALIESVLALVQQTEPRPVTFDFTGLVNISPTGLALLTAAVMDARQRGVFSDGGVKILPPTGPVWNYLQRMDVFRLILGGEAYDAIGEGFERKEAVGFRPCRGFTTYDEFPPVTRELAKALEESCDTDEVAKASIRVCLDELAENVIHHAASPLGGFAAAQGWRKTSTFEIGIVDLGIGVRQSLTKNPAYADISEDAVAIQTALQPRVTSTPERNAGIGLFITKLLLRENGGFFMVRSGKAAVYAGSQEEAVVARTPFPGTIVALRARTDRPLNIKHVYRTLGEIEDELDARDNVDSAS